MNIEDVVKLAGIFFATVLTEMLRRYVSQRREQRGEQPVQPQNTQLIERLLVLEAELARLRIEQAEAESRERRFQEPSAG